MDVAHFDTLDVAFLEKPLGDHGDGRLAAAAHHGRQQRARNLAQRRGAGLEIRLEFLLDRGVRQLIDVGGIDPMLVI